MNDTLPVRGRGEPWRARLVPCARRKPAGAAAPAAAMRSLALACLAFALALSCGGGAVAGEAGPRRELKLSVAVGPAYALGRSAESWAEGLRGTNDPALSVRTYPGATLAQRDPAREFVALREGAADLAVGSTLFWALQVPDLAVVGLPWIAPTPAHLEALAANPIVAQLAASITKAGAVPLAFAPLGHREILSARAAIREPPDLRGLALRIQASPFLAELFASLGAEPAGMAAPAARDAFVAGRLVAQEGAPATLVASRVDALGLKQLTVWGAVAEIAVFAVNRSVWSALGPAAQETVRNAALAAAQALRAASARENDTAIEALRQRGVTITRLLAPAHAQFRDASAEVYRKWAGTVDPALLHEVEAAMQAVGR